VLDGLSMDQQDLASGALVRLELETHPLLGTGFSMHAIFMKEQPPRPAGCWLIDQLKCAA